MGILPPLPAETRPRDKRLRYMAQAERAVASFQHWLEAVSYTHLDVYKRQGLLRLQEQAL